MMMMMITLLLLLLTAATTAVHSTPLSTTATLKYLRRTEQKPLSNDDPDKIKFNFSIQSSTPPYNARRVADALESFGTTLFDESATYGYRFMMFDVDPLTTTSVSVAAARGGWRRHLEEGGGGMQHSASFEAQLILERSTDLYATDTDKEEVKQFFLNGLNNGVITELGDLLGEWTAVEYDGPVATDAVGVLSENESAAAAAATQTNIPPAAVPEPTTTGPKVPNSSSTATVSAESTPVDDSSSGNINNNVLAIFFGVVGGCLVAFIFVAFVNRNRRKNRATTTTEHDVDHIGDVNACDIENEKPKELNEIDKVLADLNDSDDSSFISAVSAEDTSCYSGYSGLTGISDLNYQPKNKTETEDSKLEKVEEVKPSISFLDQSKGSLTRDTSLKRKDESFESDPSDSKGSSMGTSQSMRKEESFESDYRDKSAMATLNLKKDMLNADVGGDEKARTLSAQQNSEMMASQRQVDKVRAAKVKAKKRMKSGVGSSQKDGARSLSPKRDVQVEPDESRDRLLPSPIEKSDDDASLEIV